MATVEEIYRKIRLGDTPQLNAEHSVDTGIEAGVERIRQKLTSKTVAIPQIKHTASKAQWYVLPALAAIALVAITLFMPQKNVSTHVAVNTRLQFGSVHLYTLTTADFTHTFAANRLQLRLERGLLAIRRENADTALEVITPQGKFTARGTTFLIEVAGVTSVKLIEGKLDWQTDTETITIDKNNAWIGRNLTQELKLLPPDFHKEPKQANRVANNSHTYKIGDCVVYYRNNEKRRGKINAYSNEGYIVHGDGGPEPNRFRESDLFHSECP